MQAIGNALTIVGIVVTFVAYFGQHSGVTLADLEPGLTDRWNRARAWVRRKLGRTKTVTIAVEGAVEVNSAMSGRVSVWSPIQPGDDIAVRADKLERNLDRLREEFGEAQAEQRTMLREAEQRLADRVADLNRLVVERHEESRRAATAAMRWEVRGLLITLLGAGLSIVG